MMSEEKHGLTYRCHRIDDKFECLTSKKHGYSLESCNNICRAEYFDDILPKITISKNPLSVIAFGIGKWLGVVQEEYLKYPFDEKYIEMFSNYNTPLRKTLLDEFLDFISYKPNIYIMRSFVDIYNNNYETYPFMKDSYLFPSIDKIAWGNINITVSYDLSTSLFPDINDIDMQLSGIDENIVQYNFMRYLGESIDSYRSKYFVKPVDELADLYGVSKIYAASYLMGEIINIDNPVEVITKIINALSNNITVFTGIRIRYIGTPSHINILIFSSREKKIYYIEPHGKKYYRVKVFIDAFRKCFLKGKYTEWNLEFVNYQIQDDDTFCDSWCTLSMITVLLNERYNFDSILTLFNGLHNGINIVLVWYFTLYKRVKEITEFPAKMSMDEYIQLIIKRVTVDRNFTSPLFKLRPQSQMSDLLAYYIKICVIYCMRDNFDKKSGVFDIALTPRVSDPIEKFKHIYQKK